MAIAATTTSGDFVALDNVVLEVYSQEILFKAQPAMRFESIANKRTELQTMPGKSITFLKYNSLTPGSALAETDDLVTESLSTLTLQLTVSERGKAIQVSELLLRSAATDVLGDATTLLGMHYAKDRDSLIRDALMSGTNVLYINKRANRAAIIATDVFNVGMVRDAVEQLATAKAPKFGGDSYICFVHPHQARAAREDAAWVNVNLYASPENILNGEIGRIEDVRFIETTQIPYIKIGTQDIWADGIDTGVNTAIAANAATNVYRAVVVGDYAVGLAEALPVELRDDGVKNFGRRHSLAYYGIWGAGILEPAHSVICETA